MASQANPSLWRETVAHGARRSGALIAAMALAAAMLVLAAILASYHPGDPSFSTAAGGPARNLLGGAGAMIADATLALFGWPIVLLLPIGLLFASRLWRDVPVGRWPRMLAKAVIGIVLMGTTLALVSAGAVDTMPAGYGGAVGLALADLLRLGLAQIGDATVALWTARAIGVLVGISGIAVYAFSYEIDLSERRWRPKLPALGRGAANADPDFDDAPPAEPIRKPAPRAVAAPETRPGPVIAERAIAPSTAKPRAKQTSLDLRDNYRLPPLDLLKKGPTSGNTVIDKAALERNARLLESVLDDFHVKGNIVEVRPGPVVTMYELEPASGIKASRVIQLADDIARNMSAISARVATIPGRSVIGIELPNAKRETVNLHELVGSQSFEDQTAQLPLILGKNIAGDPVIADLAPMPHLLVAGTTGSGKSVGLNCMILSLLYRLTPDQCRMIMIDPKMLELSMYADIPHLLAPVVTEPAKAVRALKWAVEQMEDRYRMLASVNVRSLASFNDKVRAAKAKGQPLGRKVQTGYDPGSGQPVYEEEQLDFQPLPQIVVIVDELADLMMTAGKEVEFLIQRLAQKARAAGIHLIMATQRPSVDVITGVIKANLPTRISFHVTSKIDSRTILGEQGAEQLLGKGDMLYMPGGKQIARVHGPFVSDDEVQAVANHWRAQGQPDYIQSVTEEPEDGFALDGAPDGEDSAEDQQYRSARQLVAESQ
ncbi:MAG: DNA translocase FtsK 4TM domain-containing protein, partial [Sphingomonas sp.]|nr:DNA translocase FtsK 4TM domain-containing protein [Sphingomonas sp.]